MEVITNNQIQCTVALAGLYDVYDPEIGLNVVDLGLIYQIDFDEDKKEIHVLMTFTTQYCPMGASIKSNVERALTAIFEGYILNVTVTFDPPWSPARISPEGREFLNS